MSNPSQNKTFLYGDMYCAIAEHLSDLKDIIEFINVGKEGKWAVKNSVRAVVSVEPVSASLILNFSALAALEAPEIIAVSEEELWKIVRLYLRLFPNAMMWPVTTGIHYVVGFMDEQFLMLAGFNAPTDVAKDLAKIAGDALVIAKGALGREGGTKDFLHLLDAEELQELLQTAFHEGREEEIDVIIAAGAVYDYESAMRAAKFSTPNLIQKILAARPELRKHASSYITSQLTTWVDWAFPQEANGGSLMSFEYLMDVLAECPLDGEVSDFLLSLPKRLAHTKGAPPMKIFNDTLESLPSDLAAKILNNELVEGARRGNLDIVKLANEKRRQLGIPPKLKTFNIALIAAARNKLEYELKRESELYTRVDANGVIDYLLDQATVAGLPVDYNKCVMEIVSSTPTDASSTRIEKFLRNADNYLDVLSVLGERHVPNILVAVSEWYIASKPNMHKDITDAIANQKFFLTCVLLDISTNNQEVFTPDVEMMKFASYSNAESEVLSRIFGSMEREILGAELLTAIEGKDWIYAKTLIKTGVNPREAFLAAVDRRGSDWETELEFLAKNTFCHGPIDVNGTALERALSRGDQEISAWLTKNASLISVGVSQKPPK